MNCTYCLQPIALWPSASERAARSGHSASYFTSLFTAHAECEIAARAKSTPAPAKVSDLPPMFQELEMLRLRQQAARTFGIEAGSRWVAEFVNKQPEAALRAML